MQTMAQQVSIVLITESWKSVAEKKSLDLLWFLYPLVRPLCYCNLCTTENNLCVCRRLHVKARNYLDQALTPFMILDKAFGLSSLSAVTTLQALWDN